MPCEYPLDRWPQPCPPVDAEPASVTVFLISKNDPPTESDFLTHEERNVPLRAGASACQRCGLSVSRTLADALHIRSLFRRMGNYFVAGELRAEYGCVKMTPGPSPGHSTWWPCMGINRADIFKIVHRAS